MLILKGDMMPKEEVDMAKYEEELKGLIERQKEEYKSKTNPLFAKMHNLEESEVAELKIELNKIHEMQRLDLANKYGVKLK